MKAIIFWIKNRKDNRIAQNILYFILYKLNRHLLLKIWQKNSWKMKKMHGNVKSDQIWISADDDDLKFRPRHISFLMCIDGTPLDLELHIPRVTKAPLSNVKTKMEWQQWIVNSLKVELVRSFSCKCMFMSIWVIPSHESPVLP